MPLYDEPWNADRHGDKVAKIARALSQDVGKNIKKMLQKLYPTKEIQKKDGIKVDIGKNCADWHYDVITFFGENTKIQKRLLDDIRDAYEFGVYLDEDEDWLEELSEATPLISQEMKTYAQIPRLAFKDTLEKEGSKRRDIHDTKWE